MLLRFSVQHFERRNEGRSVGLSASVAMAYVTKGSAPRPATSPWDMANDVAGTQVARS